MNDMESMNGTEEFSMVYPEIEKKELSLVWNYETIHHALELMLEKYRGLIVTDENEKDMEKARREVVSIRTKLERFRKRGRAEFDAPKNEFSAKCDTLIRMVNEVEKPIAEQLEVYEQSRKDELIQRIHEEFFRKCKRAGVEEDFCALDVKSKWLNKTQKWIDTINDLDEAVASCLRFQEEEKKQKELKQLRLSVLQSYLDRRNKELELINPVSLDKIPNMNWESLEVNYSLHVLEIALDEEKKREMSIAERVKKEEERKAAAKAAADEAAKASADEAAKSAADDGETVSENKNLSPFQLASGGRPPMVGLFVEVAASNAEEYRILKEFEEIVKKLPRHMVINFSKSGRISTNGNY